LLITVVYNNNIYVNVILIILLLRVQSLVKFTFTLHVLSAKVLVDGINISIC